MKIKLKKTNLTKAYTIDYENNVYCDVMVTNNKVSSFSFKTKYLLSYVEDIELLKNSHWSKHYEFLKEKVFTFDELKNFNEFDKLYYVGSNIDGMLKDRFGNHISTVIHMDYIFFTCYKRIETSQEECLKILTSLNKEYLLEGNVIEDPYYNWSDYTSEHYSLSLKVKFPDDIYNQLLNGNSFINDQVKINIFDFLKK
jgi:hypothetical protein